MGLVCGHAGHRLKWSISRLEIHRRLPNLTYAEIDAAASYFDAALHLQAAGLRILTDTDFAASNAIDEAERIVREHHAAT